MAVHPPKLTTAGAAIYILSFSMSSLKLEASGWTIQGKLCDTDWLLHLGSLLLFLTLVNPHAASAGGRPTCF